MSGIPSELEGLLRVALQSCPEFRDQRELQALFDTVEKLAPFADRLPEASARSQRVALVIAYLIDTRRSDGTNALVLLTRALAERTNKELEQYDQLLDLANELERWFGLTHRPAQPTLEANPARATMVYVEDYEVLLRVARAVAHVSVMRYVAGQPQPEQLFTGTAWLVAPRLALTCFHVIDARGSNDVPRHASTSDLELQVQNTVLTFDYLARGRGTHYRVAALAHHSTSLDYALLRVNVPEEYATLTIDPQPVLTQQSLLYILQHPRGLPQQLSADRFERYDERPGIVQYHAATEGGTSGAPVFDSRTWRVIALHQAEHRRTQLREGLLLSAMFADLQAQHGQVYEEIRQFVAG